MKTKWFFRNNKNIQCHIGEETYEKGIQLRATHRIRSEKEHVFDYMIQLGKYYFAFCHQIPVLPTNSRSTMTAYGAAIAGLIGLIGFGLRVRRFINGGR